MEIKDITVAVERLDEVRGGTFVFPHSGATSNVSQFAAQVGGNTATSSANAWGIGNSAQSGVLQIAPQSISQSAGVETRDIDIHETSIANSLVGFSWL